MDNGLMAMFTGMAQLEGTEAGVQGFKEMSKNKNKRDHANLVFDACDRARACYENLGLNISASTKQMLANKLEKELKSI